MSSPSANYNNSSINYNNNNPNYNPPDLRSQLTFFGLMLFFLFIICIVLGFAILCLKRFNIASSGFFNHFQPSLNPNNPQIITNYHHNQEQGLPSSTIASLPTFTFSNNHNKSLAPSNSSIHKSLTSPNSSTNDHNSTNKSLTSPNSSTNDHNSTNRSIEPTNKSLASTNSSIPSPSPIPTQIDCSICLSEFQENDTCTLLPDCKHTFHTHCILAWFQSNSTCPLCRVKVSHKNDTRVSSSVQPPLPLPPLATTPIPTAVIHIVIHEDGNVQNVSH